MKTGFLSFGGAYASLIFVQQGAVAQHQWLTDGQLLDGVALSVATPGPFMLFTTFAGYLAGGVVGAILATFFVFLPSFVFVLGMILIIAESRRMREDTDTRAIDNFMVRLRRYIEDEPSEPQYLQTVRGVGYRFLPEQIGG